MTGTRGAERLAALAAQAEEMRKSVFCLAPRGEGWGIRIINSMLNGCIPIVVQVPP